MVGKSVLAKHAIIVGLGLAEAAGGILPVGLHYDLFGVHVLELEYAFELAPGLVLEGAGKLPLLRRFINFGFERGGVFVVLVDLLLQLNFKRLMNGSLLLEAFDDVQAFYLIHY